MTRVDELQKKYPTIPRKTLVKAEALTRGIRDTDLLYKHGHWSRVGGTGTNQSFDRGLSLKEIAEKRPTAAAKAGYVKRLDPFYLKGAWPVMIQRDPSSPYEIREPEPGKYALYEGEEKVEDVYFAPERPWPFREGEEPLTSTGKPITTVVTLRTPTCARINGIRYCEYFSTGEQCKYCNFNINQEDARSAGGILPITNPVEEIAEAYKILTSETRIIDTNTVGGAFTNVDKEVIRYADLVEKLGKIANAASHKPRLSIGGQPGKSRRDLQRLKDSGLDVLCLLIEVWDPQLFPIICPGKAKYIGYERYLEAYCEAADIFGAGNVHGTMVAGATLLQANGHKRWQDSRDMLIDGIQWMTKNGVVPVFLQQRLMPGSEFSKDATAVDRLPPIEHHLDVLLAEHAAMKERGLYEKMDKFSGVCPNCYLDFTFCFDLGMYEATGGDASKWLAGVIPDDLNWAARVNESIGESEPVRT